MQQDEFTVSLRLPRKIKENDIIEVSAKIKHPVTTGLQLIETAQTPYERFVRNQPAQFIRTVRVYYDDELVSTFALNSTTSNDPLLSFMLRATKEAEVRVEVVNHEDVMVEATEAVAYTLE